MLSIDPVLARPTGIFGRFAFAIKLIGATKWSRYSSDCVNLYFLPRAVSITADTAAADTAGIPTATAQGVNMLSPKSICGEGIGLELHKQMRKVDNVRAYNQRLDG